MLNKTQRKQITRRAAGMLRRKSLKWTEGTWMKNPSSGKSFDPEGETLRDARAWWQKQGFSPNKECRVCLEGALLVSMIDDPELPDSLDLRDALNEFNEDIWASARAVCPDIHDECDGETIPDLNDSALCVYLDEDAFGKTVDKRPEMALKILDRASS